MKITAAIIKPVQRYAFAAWIGGALSLAGWAWTTWQFYVTLVGFSLLLLWRDSEFNPDP